MLEVVYDNLMEGCVCVLAHLCINPSLNTHSFGGGPWMLGLVGRDKDDCVALCPLLCESPCLAFFFSSIVWDPYSVRLFIRNQ